MHKVPAKTGPGTTFGKAPTCDNRQLFEVWEKWKRLFEQGEEQPPEALGATDPELLAALAERIAQFKSGGPAPDQQLPAGSQPEIPGYQVLHVLGEGGMGTVYAGLDLTLQRSVAIKVLREKHRASADLSRRFLEEAQICGQLQHPGIVPIHWLGKLNDGRPAFVMKQIRGQTLAEVLAERDAPAERLHDLLHYFRAIAEAIAYAHSHHVIHRDLKPGNIMIGRFREVQVMDWGLAKVLNPESNESPALKSRPAESIVRTSGSSGDQRASGKTSVLGTLAYMPPEQAAGQIEEMGPPSDVFSLGAILCEILTGKPPYVGPSSEAVFQLALHGTLTDAYLRLDESGADVELVQVTKDCLGVYPQDRLPDAQAVAARMTAHLNGVQERARLAELEAAVSVARGLEERKRRRVITGALAFGLAAVMILAGIGYRFERLRASAREQALLQINLELGRVESLAERARGVSLHDATGRRESARIWEEALAADKRVELLLDSLTPAGSHSHAGEVLAQLRADEQDHARDRRMLDKLERAQDQRIDITDEDLNRTNTSALVVYGHGAEEDYAAAFRDYGIDVLSMPVEVAGRQIKERSRIYEQLISALDDWLALESNLAEARHLLAVVRAADSDDPFRNDVRQAVAEQKRPDLSAAEQESFRQQLKKLVTTALSEDRPISAYLLLADGLHLAGELDDAIRLLRHARAAHPGDFWINDLLGVYICAKYPERGAEAERYFMAASALRPDQHVVYDNLGVALAAQGRYGEAREAYEKALKLSGGTFVKAKVGKCEVLYLEGKHDEALTLCEEVRRQRPKLLLAAHHWVQIQIARGETQRAQALAEELYRAHPGHPLVAQTLALSLRATGAHDKAAEIYRALIEKHVNFAPQRLTLAYTLIASQDFDAARQEIASYRAAFPDSPAAHYAQMSLSAAQQDWPQAAAAAREAVLFMPNDYLSLSQLADFCQKSGSTDEALWAYEKACLLNPNADNVANSYVLLLIANQQWERLLAFCNHLVDKRPTYATAYAWRGMAHTQQGSFGKAQRDYEQALELNPREWLALINLGTFKYNAGRFAEAGKMFREVLVAQPGYAKAFHNLIDTLITTGDLVGAATELQARAKAYPDDSHVRLGLIFTRLELGQFEEAQKGAEEFEPTSEVEKANLAALRQLLDLALRHDELVANSAEAADFAQMMLFGKYCRLKGHYVSAARWYQAAEERFPDDFKKLAIAEFLVLARVCLGAAAPNVQPDEARRAEFRGRALAYLKRHLAASQELLDSSPQVAYACQYHVRTLLHHENLQPVRSPALEALPENERREWQEFWQLANQLLARAEEVAERQQ